MNVIVLCPMPVSANLSIVGGRGKPGTDATRRFRACVGLKLSGAARGEFAPRFQLTRAHLSAPPK
jgi:hypothetical protein